MNPTPLRDAALQIVRRLRENEHIALWAGGCVRDQILGIEPKDYDIATDAVPARVIELFRHTRKVGAQFGVVLVRIGRIWTEVATFRSDLPYEDGRHPSGVVFSSPEEDAHRRDFTVNGLFFDPIEECVVDYIDGQTDLAAGIIRAIGDPVARFREDHLRLIRAVRFAARFGFQIEPGTKNALTEQASNLRDVSRERVRDELAMMLQDPQRCAALDLLVEHKLLEHVWSAAEWSPQRVADCRRILSALKEPVSFELGMASLLHDHDPSACRRVCRDLTCSNDSLGRICRLVARGDGLLEAHPPDLGELKVLMDDRGFDDLMNFYRARLLAEDRSEKPWTELRRRADAIPPHAVRPDPFVRGDDLIEAGLEAGPAYKRILDRVYMAQLREEIQSRSEGLELLRQCLEEEA